MHQCRPYCPDDFVDSIHRKHELVTKNLLEKHKQKMTLEGTASVVNPSWSFWVKPIWLQINKLKESSNPKIQGRLFICDDLVCCRRESSSGAKSSKNFVGAHLGGDYYSPAYRTPETPVLSFENDSATPRDPRTGLRFVRSLGGGLFS